MEWNDVVEFFGKGKTSISAKMEATAAALGCTRQAVGLWYSSGIPAPRQAQIELASGGKLRADERPWEK